MASLIVKLKNIAVSNADPGYTYALIIIGNASYIILQLFNEVKIQMDIPNRSNFLPPFLSILFFVSATPAACRKAQARGTTCAVAVTRATAVIMLDP